MDFLTLHELSVQFDIPVRVLRYRLRQLVWAGKLIESQDYRRDDFVDDTHFVWKISPLAFMRLTGLQPATKPVNQTPTVATQPANQPSPVGIKPADVGEQTLLKVDTKPAGIEREMIDLLKDQVQVKDGQIADLTEQNKTVNSLNLKLTGQIVRQGEKIETLLKLTDGRVGSSQSAPKGTMPLEADFSDPDAAASAGQAA